MDIYCNLLWILEGIILLKRHIQVYLQRRDNDKVLSLFLAICVFVMTRTFFLQLGDKYVEKGIVGIQFIIFVLARYWFQRLEEKLMVCEYVIKIKERFGKERYFKGIKREKLINQKWMIFLLKEIKIVVLSLMEFVFSILILETVPNSYVNEYVKYMVNYIIYP